MATHSNRPGAALNRDVGVPFAERCGGRVVTVFSRERAGWVRTGEVCGEWKRFEPDPVAFPGVALRAQAIGREAKE